MTAAGKQAQAVLEAMLAQGMTPQEIAGRLEEVERRAPTLEDAARAASWLRLARTMRRLLAVQQREEGRKTPTAHTVAEKEQP